MVLGLSPKQGLNFCENGKKYFQGRGAGGRGVVWVYLANAAEEKTNTQVKQSNPPLNSRFYPNHLNHLQIWHEANLSLNFPHSGFVLNELNNQILEITLQNYIESPDESFPNKLINSHSQSSSPLSRCRQSNGNSGNFFFFCARQTFFSLQLQSRQETCQREFPIH